jgi:hypothetical protein
MNITFNEHLIMGAFKKHGSLKKINSIFIIMHTMTLVTINYIYMSN